MDGAAQPIFIGGHHRSGTTLLRVVLNRHPHIACGPEGQLLERTGFLEFHRDFEEMWLPQLQRFGLGPTDIDHAFAAFVASFFTRYALQRGKRRWAEKTPKNILRIDYLFRLFPDARFIHVIRDPRDAHCSVRTKAQTTTPRWADITAERTAKSWVRRIEQGLQHRSDSTRYLELRYEDLVRDPAGEMQRVLAFVDEPWDDCILAPGSNPRNEQPRVNTPIVPTSVGRWRQDLPPEDVAAIEAIAGPLMRLLGYDLVTASDDTSGGR
jgi:hypothetical protein